MSDLSKKLVNGKVIENLAKGLNSKLQLDIKTVDDKIKTHTHDDRYYTESEVNTLLADKANSEHGTHVTYATIAGKANGTAAIGTSNKVAREDHVHPLQTTISGNAGSANKVNNALSIQLNGGTATTFDGSAAKTINITPSSIGAASSESITDLETRVADLEQGSGGSGGSGGDSNLNAELITEEIIDEVFTNIGL